MNIIELTSQGNILLPRLNPIVLVNIGNNNAINQHKVSIQLKCTCGL